MSHKEHTEYPKELQPKYEQSKKLAWITVAYVVSVVVLMAMVMGQSQAMKTAWADDTVGLVSPISFLVASTFATKKPNKQFPYGYHRVANIAYICGSLALFLLGLYLLFDSVSKLISGERPSIGMAVIFGTPVWSGYLMMLVLIWSVVPAIILGKKKLPLASELHEKTLYADAETNKADWMMGLAAMAGIIGIGFGLYWADSVIAGLLSLDIIHDGFTHLKQATFDLMCERPTTVSHQEEDPVTQQVHDLLSGMDWIKEVNVRLREEGHVFYGEALIVPADTPDIITKIKEATKKVHEVDWRIKDFVLGIVDKVQAG
jgi:cation diffusion facilitator family transporter